jgi:hypothetical protein
MADAERSRHDAECRKYPDAASRSNWMTRDVVATGSRTVGFVERDRVAAAGRPWSPWLTNAG